MTVDLFDLMIERVLGRAGSPFPNVNEYASIGQITFGRVNEFVWILSGDLM